MIDPNYITTVRTGQLPAVPFNLSDKIPKEAGSDLGQNTVQNLADLIGSYLGTASSLAFNPITVLDGETLPNTTSNEWILVGKGTFHNVGGGADIITTEELNAITSNGSYWSLSVEIPISAEALNIVQTIRSGFTTTAPSEDALFNKFALYTPTSLLPSQKLVIPFDFPKLLAPQQDFIITAGKTAIRVEVNGTPYNLLTVNNITDFNTFTQSGSTVTTKDPLEIGNYIIIYIQ